MKTLIVLLFLLPFTFSCLKSGNENLTNNFQTKLESFVKKYSKNFSAVTERFNPASNDGVLNEKVETAWKENVTLKCKSYFKNKYNQKVYQRLFLGFFQYESEKLCSSALDSLLNCMGTDCAKLKWGDEERGFMTTPCFYLIGEKQIIVCKIHCEHLNNFWVEFKNDLLSTFRSDKTRVIDVGCGGYASFKTP